MEARRQVDSPPSPARSAEHVQVSPTADSAGYPVRFLPGVIHPDQLEAWDRARIAARVPAARAGPAQTTQGMNPTRSYRSIQLKPSRTRGLTDQGKLPRLATRHTEGRLASGSLSTDVKASKKQKTWRRRGRSSRTDSWNTHARAVHAR